MSATCDDAAVMRMWRECGLPEYFLGSGGTNHKLVAFAERCRASQNDALRAARDWIVSDHLMRERELISRGASGFTVATNRAHYKSILAQLTDAITQAEKSDAG